MTKTSSHLLRLAGVVTLMSFAVTKASNDQGNTLTAQEEAVCAAQPAALPAFGGLHLKSGSPLRVVAIGSSSTEGAGASEPAYAYVSQLASQLKVAWPAGSVVFNRGIGGNILSDIVARAPRDLFALHPDVVVLQTGTNDALRNVLVGTYRAQLQGLVAQIQKRHIGVILVDNQYLPAQARLPQFMAIQAATHEVAQQNDVALVSRYRLSEAFQAKFHMQPEALLASDGLHPNNVMHACTARAIEATLLGAADSNGAAVVSDGAESAQPAS